MRGNGVSECSCIGDSGGFKDDIPHNVIRDHANGRWRDGAHGGLSSRGCDERWEMRMQ